LDGKVLVIGFGNPAREDDGLGPAVAEAVEKATIDGVTVDIDYQLSIEHASDAAEYEIVVFVDAAVEGEAPFTVGVVEPSMTESFTSHSVSPGQVIGLAEKLFRARPKAYILGIRGYSFEMFREEMTDDACRNMDEAAAWLISSLRKGNIEVTMGELS